MQGVFLLLRERSRGNHEGDTASQYRDPRAGKSSFEGQCVAEGIHMKPTSQSCLQSVAFIDLGASESYAAFKMRWFLNCSYDPSIHRFITKLTAMRSSKSTNPSDPPFPPQEATR